MRLKTLMLTALAAGTLLTACQADDIPGPDAKELYTRDFIKKFGAFDPNHDWNMATQAGITVTSARPADIKVYADVSGVRYLFGTFKGVTGTRTLNVDVPKGTDRLIVKANGRTHEVAPGASLTLDSRLMTPDGTTDDNILSWRKSAQRMLPTTGLDQFIAQYPEEEQNLGIGQTSFYFIADGEEHTFYPYYWYTSATHILGIYYLPDPDRPDEIVMQDLYYTKSGELKHSAGACNPKIEPTDYKVGDVHMYGATKYTLSDWNAIGVFSGLEVVSGAVSNPDAEMQEWTDAAGDKLFQNGEVVTYTSENAVLRTANGYISRVLYYNSTFTLSETVTSPYHSDFTAEESGFIPAIATKSYEGAQHIAATGITYRLKKGTYYGFYIKVNKSGTPFFTEEKGEDGIVTAQTPKEEQNYDFVIFSQASRNASYVDSHTDASGNDRNKTIREKTWADKEWWDETKFSSLDKTAYASWGSVNVGGHSYSMFAFEDWDAETNGTGADLNDLQFVFETGLEPTTVMREIPEPEIPSFMWIIAAEDLGVTDFDFNDVVFGVTNPEVDEATGEKTVDIVPLAAGGALPVYLYYNGERIVPEGNTAEGEFHSWFEGTHASTTAINVGGYSAAPKAPVTITVEDKFTLSHCQGVKDSNMGGFTISVEKQGNYEGNVITAPNPGAGVTEAPQMICVGTNWYWPKEHVYIGIPYEGFETWCTAPAECNDWHNGENVPDEHKDKIVKHNYGGNSGNQGGNQGGGNTNPDNPDKPITPAGDVLTPTASEYPLWGSAAHWRFDYELSLEIQEKIAGATSVKLKFYSTDKVGYCQIGSTSGGEDLFRNYGPAGLPSEVKIEKRDLTIISACFFDCPEENFNITVSLVIE